MLAILGSGGNFLGMTPSQATILEEQTRFAYACTLPRSQYGLLYATPLHRGHLGGLSGRELEIGARGGLYVNSQSNNDSYFGISRSTITK